MELKHIVLLSKDATLPEYFGPYGSKYTKTPNIDELAAKGTVFRKHYTAAPSTSMAFAAMFTGKFPYQMGYDDYTEVNEYKKETLFDKLYKQGYECHLLWSKNYIKMAEFYTKCYGKHTIHHDTLSFNLSCGINTDHKSDFRVYDYQKMQGVIDEILKEVDTIDYQTKPIFLWIHMPHCMLGGISYGSDIEYFDKLVGELRTRFGDDNFFVTADHGHMNGTHGKYAYGFDVYDSAIHIPLVGPKINGVDEINFNTSNVQLSQIILEHKIDQLPYLVADSAYKAQAHRKMAILKDNFSYIFNRYTKEEELYDLELDPGQSLNLAKGYFRVDTDRRMVSDIRHVVLYPKWQQVSDVLKEMRKIRESIWEVGTFKQNMKLWIFYTYKNIQHNIATFFFKKFHKDLFRLN